MTTTIQRFKRNGKEKVREKAKIEAGHGKKGYRRTEYVDSKFASGEKFEKKLWLSNRKNPMRMEWIDDPDRLVRYAVSNESGVGCVSGVGRMGWNMKLSIPVCGKKDVGGGFVEKLDMISYVREEAAYDEIHSVR